MGSFLQVNRKCRRLPVLLRGLLNNDGFLFRTLGSSSSFYGKKKTTSKYEKTDQKKYRDLIHYLTSHKDSSQSPESLFEEDNKLYGPVSKYKPPDQDTEPKLNENWIPLMNSNKSSLPQKTTPGQPLQISLQKNYLASVTAVLQQTMPVEQAFYLERWKQRMILELGEDGFAEYTKNIFQQGKLFHSAMEMLLLAEGMPVKEQEDDINVSGYITSVQHVLKDVTGVRAVESAVQHETLHYKGLVDCVAEYRGKLCVIEWKTSGKPKPFLRNTFDNPLQLAAYIGAINHDGNYNFQVNCGLLVVAYKDGSPAHPHYMDSELCCQYWNKWLYRLEEYKEKNSGTV
ncbi:mitochondrial genome maintenance exonuclease 1 [Rhineura floridana]|uniref:mitochondrial genome maintenance exonuclease 1 n=1 Tax=Rhineura floridana TaxID=261503 RepID=UPI002AC7EC35|nr:mitochondrial genome maintenance exonuclease 1 [Rhineura floridana]XP_061441606.1 mitochondrial genome maintenance exonuclease 1 [Rhineura floridana]XP_061441616.1 mitochondrial genome maintenance exonuclease 1 [Rhineura floridana]XP_061441625.1 mitochondrial genome maintenance exonuclease 1 [Rhineura floridana]XP_061441633.1 mitochondrial genome maintenance exonuclease 1 [Rhineura floridana]XP_061441643.1 mitochondrial genome maintenance exonuclease 1 [Rhineura floridana]XP_061441651.1 mi